MGYAPDSENKKPILSLEEAKSKIAKYCAYQERAHSEVDQKLYSYGLWPDQREELLAWLITENYLNEERFAIAFALGKFRIKKWGKLKIENQLNQKRVSRYCIDKALNQIDSADYTATIEALIKKKARTTSANSEFELRNKVARVVITKGFESEQVWQITKTIID